MKEPEGLNTRLSLRALGTNGDHWDIFWQNNQETMWAINEPQMRLLNKVGVQGKTLLEVGFGSGTTSHHLSGLGAVVIGVDTSFDASVRVKMNSMSFIPVCADGHGLPFRDATFDIVFSQGVLEHFLSPLAMLAEQRRVLKTGGHLIADVPQKYQPYTMMKRRKIKANTWPFGWETEYSYTELRKLLVRNGFKVCGHYANGYYPEWFRLLRIAHTIGKTRFNRPIMPVAVGRIYNRLWQAYEDSLLGCFSLVSVGICGIKI